MSTYELDDEMVRAWLQGHPDGNFSSALREQLPLPVPTKLGAVVRTVGSPEGYSAFIRWTHDVHSTSPWVPVNDVDVTCRTDRIGRITEVLSEGVDV